MKLLITGANGTIGTELCKVCYANNISNKIFVRTNTDYYSREFRRIGAKSGFITSFNLMATLLGPIWFGARNIWNYALAFLIIETFSVVQI